MTGMKTVDDEECKLCGFPDLDGLWYDGTCDDCHDIIIEQSIHHAIAGLERSGDEESLRVREEEA
jgi:hypothetical protein